MNRSEIAETLIDPAGEAYRNCAHRDDYSTAATHERDCPEHGVDSPTYKVTEYAIMQRGTGEAYRLLPTVQTYYSDRWYGNDGEQLVGIEAAWRAVRRLREQVPGEYTVCALRTFSRPVR